MREKEVRGATIDFFTHSRLWLMTTENPDPWERALPSADIEMLEAHRVYESVLGQSVNPKRRARELLRDEFNAEQLYLKVYEYFF
jgi:hypothetical protein